MVSFLETMGNLCSILIINTQHVLVYKYREEPIVYQAERSPT
jgi:hypothetical protein